MRHLLAFATVLMLGLGATGTLADSIVLLNGDTLNGTIKQVNENNVVITHPALGDVTIANAQIHKYQQGDAEAKTLNPLPEAAKPEPKPAPKPEPKPADAKPKKPVLIPGWKSKLEAGLNGSAGNTESQSIYIRFITKRENEEEKTTFDANYYFSSRDGKESQNEFSTGVRNDWLLPDSDWFYFGQARLEIDRFEAWDQRASAALGVGYEWIKEEDFYVSLRAGLGAVKEFGSNEDNIIPEGLLGAEMGWNITDRQELTASTTYYPDLGDIPENRVVSEVAWEYKMSDLDGISLKAGIQHEYESETEGPIKHNDWKYFTGIIMDF